jgi:tetratricopeptide (TPR) repeat protein
VVDSSHRELAITIDELMTAGVAHQEARRLSAAAGCFSRVVELAPEHGQAWRRLGIVAFFRGDRASSRDSIARALRIDAADAIAHRLTGAIDEIEGNIAAAYAAYGRAHAIDPMDASAAIGLVRVSLALGQPAQAITVAEAAIACGIGDPELLRALGAARILTRDPRGALHVLETALRVEPHPQAFTLLAAAALELQRVDTAVDACERALALDPKHGGATLHLGIARLTQGAFAQAITAFEQAILLGCDEAHINLGRLHLLLGNHQDGWPHFGWDDVVRRALPPFRTLPLWDGSAAPGKHLLVWHEQGVGDTIMMARFLQAARARVGSVTLACPPETVELFGSIAGIVAVAATRTIRSECFDLWLPTTRLPVLFNARPDAESFVPYLFADGRRMERFRSRLDVPERLRVGLVWSGNPNFVRNNGRSCGLGALEELSAVPGVAWFALQQGSARADQPRSGMRLDPINLDVTDYADTAAIIAQLDLVITVDTSVANLAGALGRPAWVLLGKTPDWRWQLAGDVSPWYPTLRLFRQHIADDWTPVISQIANELRTLASARASAPAAA